MIVSKIYKAEVDRVNLLYEVGMDAMNYVNNPGFKYCSDYLQVFAIFNFVAYIHNAIILRSKKDPFKLKSLLSEQT